MQWRNDWAVKVGKRKLEWGGVKGKRRLRARVTGFVCGGGCFRSIVSFPSMRVFKELTR